MFSKSCEYGLRATIYVAEQSILNNKVGLKTIAKEIGSPEAFTGKILQILTKNNIITSVKGPYGGFLIDVNQLKEIKLSQIVNALDGDGIYTSCALGLKNCSAKYPCPLHDKFLAIRESLRIMLESNTLHDILYKKGGEKTCLWFKR
jgi:Rrf2 family protein